MSDLKTTEQNKFEKFLGMGTGYVSDFSDRTFQFFVIDSIEVDAYVSPYDEMGTSKARRLRCLIKKLPNSLISKLLKDLIEHEKLLLIDKREFTDEKKQLFLQCEAIFKDLNKRTCVENTHVLKTIDTSEKENLKLLTDSIKADINNGDVRLALDRLHTFLQSYFRDMLDRYNQKTRREDKASYLYKQLISYQKSIGKNSVDSRMAEQITRSHISILDTYNELRNNQSLAHDNELISNTEAIFIVEFVLSLIKYIESLKKELWDVECNQEKVKDMGDDFGLADLHYDMLHGK